MSKSKDDGKTKNWGGKRPGAGRKRILGIVGEKVTAAKTAAVIQLDPSARRGKAKTSLSPPPEAAIAAPTVAGVTPIPKERLYTRAEVDEMISTAITEALAALEDKTEAPAAVDELEPLALKTLRSVMKHGPQDGPRVSAALKVLEKAEAARMAAGANGKKQMAQAAAEARISSGGKFAAPAPPPGAISTRPQ